MATNEGILILVVGIFVAFLCLVVGISSHLNPPVSTVIVDRGLQNGTGTIQTPLPAVPQNTTEDPFKTGFKQGYAAGFRDGNARCSDNSEFATGYSVGLSSGIATGIAAGSYY